MNLLILLTDIDTDTNDTYFESNFEWCDNSSNIDLIEIDNNNIFLHGWYNFKESATITFNELTWFTSIIVDIRLYVTNFECDNNMIIIYF